MEIKRANLRVLVEQKLGSMEVGITGRYLVNREVLAKSMTYQQKWLQAYKEEEIKEQRRRF